MKSLFLGYKAHVAKLVTLSVNSSELPFPGSSATNAEEERIEKVLSKSQYEITVKESKFWNDCITSLTSDAPALLVEENGSLRNLQGQLDTLLDKSYMMASMYERRADIPTQETYREAKYILEAMGIPCIEVNGAYEAEALASSMVLAGLADYVVSEDTV